MSDFERKSGSRCNRSWSYPQTSVPGLYMREGVIIRRRQRDIFGRLLTPAPRALFRNTWPDFCRAADSPVNLAPIWILTFKNLRTIRRGITEDGQSFLGKGEELMLLGFVLENEGRRSIIVQFRFPSFGHLFPGFGLKDGFSLVKNIDGIRVGLDDRLSLQGERREVVGRVFLAVSSRAWISASDSPAGPLCALTRAATQMLTFSGSFADSVSAVFRPSPSATAMTFPFTTISKDSRGLKKRALAAAVLVRVDLEVDQGAVGHDDIAPPLFHRGSPGLVERSIDLGPDQRPFRAEERHIGRPVVGRRSSELDMEVASRDAGEAHPR